MGSSGIRTQVVGKMFGEVLDRCLGCIVGWVTRPRWVGDTLFGPRDYNRFGGLTLSSEK